MEAQLNEEVTSYLEKHGEWVTASNMQSEVRMLMDWRVHDLTNVFLSRIVTLEAENTRLKAQLESSHEHYMDELHERNPYLYDALCAEEQASA